ncbi:hypothetical protein HDE_07734 [Halotydeus destructor]|nr:hypothetical protein HDE_07734 [Halotydeus destructor]
MAQNGNNGEPSSGCFSCARCFLIFIFAFQLVGLVVGAILVLGNSEAVEGLEESKASLIFSIIVGSVITLIGLVGVIRNHYGLTLAYAIIATIWLVLAVIGSLVGLQALEGGLGAYVLQGLFVALVYYAAMKMKEIRQGPVMA